MPKPKPAALAPERAAKVAVTVSLHDELRKLSPEEPLLVEVAVSAHNVSSPTEAPVESWIAVAGGGFVRCE